MYSNKTLLQSVKVLFQSFAKTFTGLPSGVEVRELKIAIDDDIHHTTCTTPIFNNNSWTMSCNSQSIYAGATAIFDARTSSVYMIEDNIKKYNKNSEHNKSIILAHETEHAWQHYLVTIANSTLDGEIDHSVACSCMIRWAMELFAYSKTENGCSLSTASKSISYTAETVMCFDLIKAVANKNGFSWKDNLDSNQWLMILEESIDALIQSVAE